jgi:uncharacterized protein
VKRTPRWTSLALVVLALGYLSIGLFVATQLTTPVREPMERTPADAGLDFREVSFESSDGLDLEGWWVPEEEDSSRAMVLVRGFGGDMSSRYVVETAPIYARTGYGVLILDR